MVLRAEDPPCKLYVKTSFTVLLVRYQVEGVAAQVAELRRRGGVEQDGRELLVEDLHLVGHRDDVERGERLVESEPLRESLGALGTEVVVLETARE